MASGGNNSNGRNLRTRWLEAFDETKNYRKRLESKSIPVNEKIKCYSLHRDEIEALLRQHDKEMDGIRIYIGEKHFANNEFTIKLYVVPTEKVRGTHGEIMYNDFHIPTRQNLERDMKPDAPVEHLHAAAETAAAPQNKDQQLQNLVELRPCPQECSNNNDLNS